MKVIFLSPIGLLAVALSVRQIFKKHPITVTNTHLTHHTFPLMTHPLLNHCYKHTPNTSPSCHTLCHTLCSITVGTCHTSYTSTPAATPTFLSLLQTHTLHFHHCCHTLFSITVTNTHLTFPPLLPHPLLCHCYKHTPYTLHFPAAATPFAQSL